MVKKVATWRVNVECVPDQNNLRTETNSKQRNLTINKTVRTIFYADDQLLLLLLANSEDCLQLGAQLKIADVNVLNISSSKSEIMTMCRNTYNV